MESTNQKGKQEEEKMSTLITVLLYLVCHGGMCHVEELNVSREALAVATCESGDTENYGTLEWGARSNKQNGDGTFDYGAFQFNENTYLWLTGRTNAAVDSPVTQYETFVRLWNNGKGWTHWKASKPCWSQWLTINDKGVAVWR
jgi:hypothetical protein